MKRCRFKLSFLYPQGYKNQKGRTLGRAHEIDNVGTGCFSTPNHAYGRRRLQSLSGDASLGGFKPEFIGGPESRVNYGAVLWAEKRVPRSSPVLARAG